jgi:hypothetical protein
MAMSAWPQRPGIDMLMNQYSTVGYGLMQPFVLLQVQR